MGEVLLGWDPRLERQVASYRAGGGRASSGSGSIGLSVVGVPLEAGTAAELEIDETGPLLLAHELGHVLGLLDEYSLVTDSTGDIPFEEGRNIWEATESEVDALTAASTDESRLVGSAIPWSMVYQARCGTGLRDCTASTGPSSGTCPRVEWSTAGSGCGYSCASSPPGLWEGGFYKLEDYYRARSTCTMQKLDSEVPFCEACLWWLGSQLCAYGGTCASTPEVQKARCP